VASIHSEIVFARTQDGITVTMRGPETQATQADDASCGEFIGIVLKPGVFMPHLLPKNLIDRRDASLPLAGSRSFWLDSAAWEIPDFENADVFAARLIRAGLLAHDPVVDAVLQGETPDLSPRAVQYRFVQATGLSHKRIQQIERAHQALALLQSGTPILEAAFTLGYFDQSHMTNALKRFMGQTPAQIARMSLSK
jgi:AraC-like DNA-binding protein